MTQSEASKQLDQNLIVRISDDVASVEPYDSLEEDHKKDVLAWLQAGENIFRLRKPDTPPKHLVSYFVLVDSRRKSILLVDHIKAQLWLPSGGHVKFNESPRDAVVREAKEEFNIDAKFLHSNGKPFFVTVTETGGLTPGHVDVSLWYLISGNVHEYLYYDKSEFHDTEWYTMEEILSCDPVIFDPHLQRFAEKLNQKIFNRRVLE